MDGVDSHAPDDPVGADLAGVDAAPFRVDRDARAVDARADRAFMLRATAAVRLVEAEPVPEIVPAMVAIGLRPLEDTNPPPSALGCGRVGDPFREFPQRGATVPPSPRAPPPP